VKLPVSNIQNRILVDSRIVQVIDPSRARAPKRSRNRRIRYIGDAYRIGKSQISHLRIILPPDIDCPFAFVLIQITLRRINTRSEGCIVKLIYAPGDTHIRATSGISSCKYGESIIGGIYDPVSVECRIGAVDLQGKAIWHVAGW